MDETTDLTAKEMRDIIDMYMPTIITGIDHIAERVRAAREREEWDEDDVAVLAAYSYAHNMLKRLGVRQNANGYNEVDYDLPSVIDLMENLKARSKAIDKTIAAYPETKQILGRFEGRLFGGAYS
jgi:hypothetical protein